MSEHCVVQLPDRVDISCVEALHLELEDALSSGKQIQLDGKQVTKLDSAGLQVLAAFYTETQSQHLELEWVSPSETIKEVTDFLNLGPALGLNE